MYREVVPCPNLPRRMPTLMCCARWCNSWPNPCRSTSNGAVVVLATTKSGEQFVSEGLNACNCVSLTACASGSKIRWKLNRRSHHALQSLEPRDQLLQVFAEKVSQNVAIRHSGIAPACSRDA